MPAHFYDAYQWRPGRAGLYESNYIKANSPDGERALWIKHNILAPLDPSRPAVAELWCVLFTKGRAPQVIKETLPMDRLSLSSHEARMEGAGVLICPTHTTTRIQSGERSAHWDIRFSPAPEPAGAPVVIFPWARLYTLPFPRKKLVTPAPLTRWEGELVFDGERIAIEGWTGFRNHNWGTEHAHRYAYGNCNLFDDREGALFEGFSARLKLGSWVTPFISAGLLRLDGDDSPWNSLGALLRARAEVSFPRWSLHLDGPAGRAEVVQEAPPETFVGLRYHHPDGARSFCYNSKFARTRVRFEPRSGSAVELVGDRGELEILEGEPVAGIELHG